MSSTERATDCEQKSQSTALSLSKQKSSFRSGVFFSFHNRLACHFDWKIDWRVTGECVCELRIRLANIDHTFVVCKKVFFSMLSSEMSCRP